ncbi:MAG: cupin domain-containing protein [Deltaproteobacteria bacterium]|nr:cupin domain-containing protein [Deltaproteobacteria bacterium]
MIEKLPNIDVPVAGVSGKLVQAGDQQMVFFDVLPSAKIPPHSHGAQWGIVIDGELDLTIDGQTQNLKKGDSYFIPAGAIHSATFKVRSQILDYFDEPARYRPNK